MCRFSPWCWAVWNKLRMDGSLKGYSQSNYFEGFEGYWKTWQLDTWTVVDEKKTSCHGFWMKKKTPQQPKKQKLFGSCKFWPGCFICLIQVSSQTFSELQPSPTKAWILLRSNHETVELRKAISKTATTLKNMVVTNTHCMLHRHWPHRSTSEIIQYNSWVAQPCYQEMVATKVNYTCCILYRFIIHRNYWNHDFIFQHYCVVHQNNE